MKKLGDVGMTTNGKRFPCQDLTYIEDLYIKGKKNFFKIWPWIHKKGLTIIIYYGIIKEW